ncbi:MAG: hypothetical protein O7A08_13125 [SAR324 cluster bacterium]|nr:hypothetical protein [SAR324 cluster bacterium]
MQVRVEQGRALVLRERERETAVWLAGERRRVGARARKQDLDVQRVQAFNTVFLRRQSRQETAPTTLSPRTVQLRQDYRRSQARFARLSDAAARRKARLQETRRRLKTGGRLAASKVRQQRRSKEAQPVPGAPGTSPAGRPAGTRPAAGAQGASAARPTKSAPAQAPTQTLPGGGG